MRRPIAVLAIAGALSLLPCRASAQSIAIAHDGIDCIQAGKFPQFFARLDPGDAVSRARLHFRPAGWPHWYSVAMQPEGANFVGVLPKPEKSLTKIEYYLSVTDKNFGESRSQEYAPVVVSGPAACEQKKLLAAVLPRARSVIVSPPQGIAGLPKVPLGFSGDGVVAATSGTASAAAGTAGAGAAGGGLSTIAVVGIVGGGAAIAGVAVAASGGGSSGSGGSPSTTAAPATTTTPPATTAPPAPATLTGTWVGTGQAGMNVVRKNPGSPDCSIGLDTNMSLTQSENSLSGTMAITVRSASPSGCDTVGQQVSGNVAGSVSGSSVSLTWTTQFDVFNFTGTVSGGSMSGSVNGRALDASNETFAGTWSALRI